MVQNQTLLENDISLSKRNTHDCAKEPPALAKENQADLDGATAQLVSEKKKYSGWTVIILGMAILATVASMLLQK
jgi:hypothetical protein